MPTSCEAPLASTLSGDSWNSHEHPAEVAAPLTYTLPQTLDGCNHLPFEPSITVSPDVPDASTSTGLTVDVHVPQQAALNPSGLAESTLRNTTVALPEGVAVNPSGGDGLEGCTGDPAARPGTPGNEIGYEGSKELTTIPGTQTRLFSPFLPESIAAVAAGNDEPLRPGVNFCANASKIGTVKITTPLLRNPLEGAVYLATQNSNPFGSLIAMYLIAEDPVSGTLIKVSGQVTLNPVTGQLVSTFENTPELPFEDLELHFFGGERAPLATPAHCGPYTTTTSFAPWSGNQPATPSSTFNISSGPNGGACPGAQLPFSPTLTGGALNLNAGAFSPFTLTMTRRDGEQNLQSVEAKLPPGLSGILSNIELCSEPQANEGKCPPNSLIGESTVSVGVGGHPFSVSGGRFYLTGPYNGTGGCTPGPAASGCAPFGITFEGSPPRRARSTWSATARTPRARTPATAWSSAARSKSTR